MPTVESAPLLPLEIRSLCYRAGEETLLDNIDLCIETPGISVIMGANGAGKSLLLRLVHGLLEPQSGEVRWHGAPMDETLRRRQGLVFQKPVLMRRSVAANIDFVLKPMGGQYRQRRDQLLRQAGLARQWNQPARLLSGGEQQKLALARALATDPEVLLLDEPCASIDSASTLQIETLLRDTRERGVKIILVTHDIGQAHRLLHAPRQNPRTQPGKPFFRRPRQRRSPRLPRRGNNRLNARINSPGG
jgi:tungstate transport system ATP-binding protein